MDSPDKLLVFTKQETSKKFQQQSTRVSLTSSHVSNCSDIDDNEEPLSHAENSAIEGCLKDTEGSLSRVYLRAFDNMHKTKQTREQHTSERVNMDIDGNSIDRDFSEDEADTRKLQFLKEKIQKSRNLLKISSIKYPNLLSSTTYRRIVRRKRKNTPMRKTDKKHIYSFFSAMADLVSTFSKDRVAKAKQNMNKVLEEIVDKLLEWFRYEDPTNPTYGFDYDLFDYSLIQDKLARLQDMN